MDAVLTKYHDLANDGNQYRICCHERLKSLHHVSLHLNVPERQMLGSDCVSFEEVAAVVKRLLELNGVFPPNARPWQPGESVFEGFFLIKRADGNVQMIWQRSNPVRQTELADHGSSEYDNLDEAVSNFINSEWSSRHGFLTASP